MLEVGDQEFHTHFLIVHFLNSFCFCFLWSDSCCGFAYNFVVLYFEKILPNFDTTPIGKKPLALTKE